MNQWLEKRDTLDIPSQSALSLAWEKGEDVLVSEVLTSEQVVILDFARITPDQISQLHISEMLYWPYDSSEERA